MGYCIWHPSTFTLIEQYRAVFDAVAMLIEAVSPQAIAGAMARENSRYQYITDQEKARDAAQLARIGLHGNCLCQYSIAERLGLIEDAWKPLKGPLPILMDFGPFNTQGANALRVLFKYAKEHPNDDPLLLKQYLNDCPRFLAALSGLTGNAWETMWANAAIWGLMLVEAKEWFESKFYKKDGTIDTGFVEYWNSLKPWERDALLAMWCFVGPKTMQNLYEDNVSNNGGTYRPEPREGDSGAWNVYNNSGEIGRRTGKPGYGVDGPGGKIYYEEKDNPDTIDALLAECDPDPDPRNPWGKAAGSGSTPRRDPLALDLDGDGVETTDVAGGTFFDHDADGFAEQTGWVDRNDGLLAMDRNGDGIISDDRELFGNETPLSNGTLAGNGFQALAELDRNKDGRIDAADPAFSQLRVWKDSNGDGYSSPYELHTLDELGIAAINLNSTADSTVDAHGNTRTALGTFEWADGTTGEIAEYSFQRDMMNTIANEWVDAPPEIWALPILPGYGKVDNLAQAMVKDATGELRSLLEQIINAADPSSRNALLEQLLFKWTGSENIDPTSRGPNIDARKLNVLEIGRASCRERV